jgi:hypothetical protein
LTTPCPTAAAAAALPVYTSGIDTSHINAQQLTATTAPVVDISFLPSSLRGIKTQVLSQTMPLRLFVYF